MSGVDSGKILLYYQNRAHSKVTYARTNGGIIYLANLPFVNMSRCAHCDRYACYPTHVPLMSRHLARKCAENQLARPHADPSVDWHKH